MVETPEQPDTRLACEPMTSSDWGRARQWRTWSTPRSCSCLSASRESPSSGHSICRSSHAISRTTNGRFAGASAADLKPAPTRQAKRLGRRRAGRRGRLGQRGRSLFEVRTVEASSGTGAAASSSVRGRASNSRAFSLARSASVRCSACSRAAASSRSRTSRRFTRPSVLVSPRKSWSADPRSATLTPPASFRGNRK